MDLYQGFERFEGWKVEKTSNCKTIQLGSFLNSSLSNGSAPFNHQLVFYYTVCRHAHLKLINHIVQNYCYAFF